MHKMFHSFDGTRISYHFSRGQLPLTLIFLHGVGANWTVWKHELRHFQQRNFPTLALDLRGHGWSDAPEEPEKYCLQNFSRDLYELIKAEKIRRFALIGHSLGGSIAVVYCMEHHDHFPTSIILVESATSYPFRHHQLFYLGPRLSKLFHFLARHQLIHHPLLTKDTDLSLEGIREEFHMLYHLLRLTTIRSVVKTLEKAEQFAREYKQRINQTLHRLTIPALLIAGEQDGIIPPHFSKYIFKLVRRAELKVVPGDHRVVIQQAPEISQLIDEFLQRKVLSRCTDS